MIGKYLTLGAAAVATLSLAGAMVQTSRLKSCKADAAAQSLSHQATLAQIASSSRERALASVAKAHGDRVAQLLRDKELSDQAAAVADARRKTTDGLLARLQKERDNELQNDPDGCHGRPLSADTLDRLRAVDDAGRGYGSPGSDPL